MITIYSTPTCFYCKKAKELFHKKGCEFQEKNVAIDLDARKEMFEKSGQMGVPVIEINGEVMIGFDESKINNLLK